VQAVTNKQNSDEQCQKVGLVQIKQFAFVKNCFEPNNFQKDLFKNKQSPGFGIEHNELLYISKVQRTGCYVTQFIYFSKMLYMFQAVPPPIIRSSNCMYGKEELLVF
jgi:hypothetical protein